MKKNNFISNDYSIPAEIVIDAYKRGLFPMAETAFSKEIYWLEPKKRGVIFFDKIKINRKLKKMLKSCPFKISVDTKFEEVIECCSKLTANRKDTWINDTIKKIYINLFKKGYAHSVECYIEGKLVGGLYGVAIGSVFFGESMFSFVSNASKFALIHLIERLIVGQFKFLDTQFLNDFLKQFGAEEIQKKEFKSLLNENINTNANFHRLSPKGFLSKKLYPLEKNIIIFN